jgi:hypothetical protein
LLVLNADRHPEGKWRGSVPRREILGGSFSASDGGRQVMPGRLESADTESGEHPVPAPRHPAEHREHADSSEQR